MQVGQIMVVSFFIITSVYVIYWRFFIQCLLPIDDAEMQRSNNIVPSSYNISIYVGFFTVLPKKIGTIPSAIIHIPINSWLALR